MAPASAGAVVFGLILETQFFHDFAEVAAERLVLSFAFINHRMQLAVFPFACQLLRL